MLSGVESSCDVLRRCSLRLEVKKTIVSGFYMAHLLEYILINYINYFLIAVTKHLTKKQLKEKGLILAHSSEDCSPLLLGKAWQQEHETADHIEPGVWREIDMNTGTHLAFSIYLLSSSYPSS